MKTKCKEKPILFSGPMVRAILDGKKTQTRRVVKYKHSATIMEDESKKTWPFFDCYVFGTDEPVKAKCPYGAVGDRLWVRENWRVAECYDGMSGKQLTGKLSARNVQYEALLDKYKWLEKVEGRYRHARFMPRWASRINLEITGIRVERLQEIDPWDVVAEGIDSEDWHHSYDNSDGDFIDEEKPILEFKQLWDTVNGKRESGRKTHNKKHAKQRENYSWTANPYVWVVEFKRVEETK